MATKIKKLIILGSGPAGYTAAIYASRSGLQPTLITGLEVGGQMTTTTDVDNWPGDNNGVQGPELMERMRAHSEKFGTEIIYDSIMEAKLNQDSINLRGDSGEYCSETLIIATGASAKYLGLESEKRYLGRGVSACATCDGFFFKGKDVAVVGGGNTAVEEALYLASVTEHVTIIHRRDRFRAEKILVDKVMELVESGKITILWNHNLEEVIGDSNGVSGLRVKDSRSKASIILGVHGVFIAIGHQPNTNLFKGQILMKDDYILVNCDESSLMTQTSNKRVFAAGDVSDPIYRQAITSAGSGCMAALDVKKFFEINND